jgi:hypothetical protein
MATLSPTLFIGALLLSLSVAGCGAASDRTPDSGSESGHDSGGETGHASDAGIMPAPVTCGTVLPCGGDLTGTWKVLGGCILPAGLVNAACQDSTTQLVTLSYAGSVTFNGDMTYTTTHFTETRTDIDTYPSDCLASEGVTCAETSAIYGGHCTGSSTCTCSTGGTGNVIGNSGTYSAVGDELTFSTTANTSIQGYAWCVQNDLLHLITYETLLDTAGTPTPTIMSDIVAQRQ